MKKVLLIHPSTEAVSIIKGYLRGKPKSSFSFEHYKSLSQIPVIESYAESFEFCLIDEACLTVKYKDVLKSIVWAIPTLRLFSQPEAPIGYDINTFPSYFDRLSYEQLEAGNLVKSVNLIKKMFNLFQEVNQREKVLWEVRDELDSTTRRLEHFTDFVSHDIRPHICRVLGLSELAMLDSKEMGFADLQQLTWESAKKLDDMIMSIHEYLFLQPDLMSGRKESVRLASLVEEVVHEAKMKLDDQQANIQISLDPDIELSLFPIALKLCLQNLVHSSLEFANKNFLLKIHSEYSDGHLCLILTDNGSGHANKRKRVKPDTKLEVSSYVASSLLEDMGIEMKVNSDPGKNTSYFLKFSPSHLLQENNSPQRETKIRMISRSAASG